MKLNTTGSPKFDRLQRRADLSRLETVGTLELLWLFTMEHAPAGDIGKWDDEDIEARCEWTGKPGALVDALVASGWIDKCATHRLVIHDWADHLPEFLKLRVKRETLTIATATPFDPPQTEAQPDADQSPTDQGPDDDPTGPVIVEREGKGREAEGSQGEGRGEPPDGGTHPKARKAGCPEELPEPQASQAVAWALERGVLADELAFRWERVRRWSDQNPDQKRTAKGWYATLRNAIEDEWGGPWQSARGEPESPAQARQRRGREAAREALSLLEGGSAG